jgi:hypothetical protein
MDRMERGPIFIGGVERSGTSLLYALLASHPNIAMTRRTNLWPFFYKQYGNLAEPQNLDRLLTTWKTYRRVWVLHPDLEAIRKKFYKGETSYTRLFALLWGQIAARMDKPRWGDKSLNTERYADVIFRAYPGARILHIVRDPRDRFASALKRWKVIRGGVGSGAGMWLDSVRIGYHNLRKYPNQYRFVRYESLASEPEKMMREICDFIGEKYTPEMLTMRGAENFRDEGGNSSFEQHTPGTISTSSVGRYRKYLTPRSIAFIQAAAGREMQSLDYALDDVSLPNRERLLFAALDMPLNSARLNAWRLREAYLDRVGRPIPPSRLVDIDSDTASLSLVPPASSPEGK